LLSPRCVTRKSLGFLPLVFQIPVAVIPNLGLARAFCMVGFCSLEQTPNYLLGPGAFLDSPSSILLLFFLNSTNALFQRGRGATHGRQDNHPQGRRRKATQCSACSVKWFLARYQSWRHDYFCPACNHFPTGSSQWHFRGKDFPYLFHALRLSHPLSHLVLLGILLIIYFSGGAIILTSTIHR